METARINYENLEEPVKIDKKDKRILSLLSDNSRTPLTQIAKKVKLSRDAVDYRIKRLQEKGVILAFFPNINYARLGYYIFHVFLSLDESKPEELKNLTKYVKQHPNVFSVIEYSDRWDLEIVLIAKDLVEFDSIIMEMSGKYPNVIIEKDKLEIIRRYNVSHVPPLLREEGHETEVDPDRPEPLEIDPTDKLLLKHLSKDCRQSTYKIGEKLKISADAVSYRIKQLQERNVIRNFTILVNYSKMGYHWYTFSVEVKMFDRKNEAKFWSFLNKHKNILRSAKTLGGWDLMIYMIVDRPREFHTIIKDFKTVFASVTRHYQTWIAYKEHVFKTAPEVVWK